MALAPSVRTRGGGSYGCLLFDANCLTVCHHNRTRLQSRKIKEFHVSWIDLLGAALALGIFFYLVIALLFPEKFR
ncbi:MAG: potassium-transporting ATPase subunit F [Methylococcales bacterium]